MRAGCRSRTLVNLVAFLIYADVNASPATWNIIGIGCLAAAVIAAIIVRITLRNFVYPLPIAWASAAIGAKQSGNTPIVVTAAIACVACLILSGSIVTELSSGE